MTRYIHSLDLRLFLALQHSSLCLLLCRVARAVSRTGDGWLYLLIMPASIYLLQAERSNQLIMLALSGFVLERSLYFVLKLGLKRPRPPEAILDYQAMIQASDRFSLPSGHSSAAFFVATFLSLGVSLIFLPLYLWALAVALSRVILGVHFPTDILVGASLGTSIAMFIL